MNDDHLDLSTVNKAWRIMTGKNVFDCNILVSSHHMRDGCLTHNLQYSEEAVPSQDSNIVCMTLVMVSWHHILTLLTASFLSKHIMIASLHFNLPTTE